MSFLIRNDENREILRRVKEMALAFGNCEPCKFQTQVQEYVASMLVMEKGRKPYKGRSPQRDFVLMTFQLPCRPKVVELLIKICEAEKYCSATLAHGVYLFDRFADAHQIALHQIYMVAVTCLAIAGKLEENDAKTPKIKKLCLLYLPRGSEFNFKLYTAMEKFILEFYEFKILVPTEVNFLDYYLLFALDGLTSFFSGGIPLNDGFHLVDPDCNQKQLYIAGRKVRYPQLLVDIYETSIKALKIIIRVGPSQSYPSSLIAAAILMFARRNFQINCWTKKLEWTTSYSLHEVTRCLRYFVEPCCRPYGYHFMIQDPIYIDT